MFVYVRQDEVSYERNSVELKKKIGVQLRKKAEAKRAAGRSLRGSLVGVSQLAGVLHLHKILHQQLQNGPGRHGILGWGPV